MIITRKKEVNAMKKRTFLLVFLTAILSLGIFIPAYGEETLITSVPLSFSWDKVPKAGDLVGEVYANTTSRQFTVEGTSYYKRDDTWVFGERPVVEVALSAKSGYRFTSNSRKYFSLFGCGAQFKKATMDSDGNSLVLQVTFPTLDSMLPASTAVSWSNSNAVWDEVEGSKSYEVQLYRNNRLMSTVKAKHDRFDFRSYINMEGDYTFCVRAYGTYKSQAGPWSERSEPYTVTKEDAWYFDNGTWKRDRIGRRYVYKNNAYPTNTWRCIDNKWYYFNYDGYVQTNCYIKSTELDFYYWLGPTGAWDTDKDTFHPDITKYEIIKE
jgi:hypothetical protein